MAQATFNFPKGFLWGTSTSSYQVEGRNQNNQWAAWEQEPGRIFNDDRCGLACDWWGGRWKEDFDRAVEGRQNAHRLSIEWSRVQPAPDRWDEDVLDYYRQMLRGLAERGITPMVTLHHFTDPLWFAEKGGWESEEAPGLFAAYTTRVVEALKEYARLWVTINEPNVYATNGYLASDFPPGIVDFGAAFRVMAGMVRGHAAAYQAIRHIQPQAQVGVAHHYRDFEPARPALPTDIWAAQFFSTQFNNAFSCALANGRLRFAFKSMKIPAAAGTQDFFGMNYYSGDHVAFAPRSLKLNLDLVKRFYPDGSDLSPNQFIANQPGSFWKALKWSAGFHLPILVTENGTEDADDAFRRRYLVQHLHQVWRAVNFGVPVKGYFHWSLVDNFEWSRGWTLRFGLWGLDPETQSRFRRRSGDLYAAVCKENALSSVAVSSFAPEVFSVLFPE